MNEHQQEFCEFFEKAHHDTVLDISLARIDENSGINGTSLAIPAGRSELWGLFLIAEKGLHFYDHATENSLLSLFKKSNALPAQPQILSVGYSSIKRITCEQPKKKRWNFFNQKEARISLNYSDEIQGNKTIYFYIPCENKKFIQKLSAILQEEKL